MDCIAWKTFLALYLSLKEPQLICQLLSLATGQNCITMMNLLARNIIILRLSYIDADRKMVNTCNSRLQLDFVIPTLGILNTLKAFLSGNFHLHVSSI